MKRYELIERKIAQEYGLLPADARQQLPGDIVIERFSQYLVLF